jgi:YD repeat-containing protein
MWLQNGAIMIFKPCSPKSEAACTLTRMRDSADHWTYFRRDGDGILREIVAGAATIAFEYDDAGRIRRARASTGRFVEYAYDRGGRLVRVRTTEGDAHAYSYGSRGEMLTIEEPGWFIRNTYRDGRVVRQDTESRAENGLVRRLRFTWEYALRGGRVWMTEVERPDGSRTRYEFDQAGYHVAETLQDARGRSARIVLERDRASHGVQRLKLTCLGANARASEHRLENQSVRDRTSELLQSCWKSAAR